MAAAAGPNVVETVPTEFDYFESRVVQATITQQYDQDFGPVGTIQPGAPIEIIVPETSSGYRDLNNSRLEIKCKIQNLDGTALPNDEPVGPTNLFLHSMFSNIEMDINGKRISDPNNFYPYRAFFETLLSHTKDVKETRLLAEGWKDDTAGHFDDFRLVVAGANAGFKARAARFVNSNTVFLIGRPHLDLFHQDKDIPPGCSIVLRLIPSPTNFAVKKPANNVHNFKIEIISVKLWVRTKEVAPALQLAHAKMLNSGINFRIPYTKVTLKHMTIPNGITSIQFDNIYQGMLPSRVLFAFIQDDHLNAAATANPFLFGHLNLSQLSLTMEGRTYPRTPYAPNFATNDYIREYLGLLEALDIETGNKSIDLTPTKWAATYPFFMFSTSPSGYASIPQTGAARLDLQFRVATTEVYDVICFAEFPAILEIDKFKNALI